MNAALQRHFTQSFRMFRPLARPPTLLNHPCPPFRLLKTPSQRSGTSATVIPNVPAAYDPTSHLSASNTVLQPHPAPLACLFNSQHLSLDIQHHRRSFDRVDLERPTTFSDLLSGQAARTSSRTPVPCVVGEALASVPIVTFLRLLGPPSKSTRCTRVSTSTPPSPLARFEPGHLLWQKRLPPDPIKLEIDSFEECNELSQAFTRAKFEELNLDFSRKTLKSVERVLKDASMKEEGIDDVVLVGGFTRMPIVLPNDPHDRPLPLSIQNRVRPPTTTFGDA
ncbi:hypothetical protein M407DRAFT_28191 [Tulasnella calospora MUT 4182]|uniref:Uncharacterized protein n=1 Tax=Tulasnella calospora MUT 4182 TaxID=1051891 RepID=A0A0C3LLV2_9AGAM|nr:hypothetical protein M407DRAFT_28191 [Tulasnella calospora MUT 4182]